jgi:hypothetical protein
MAFFPEMPQSRSEMLVWDSICLPLAIRVFSLSHSTLSNSLSQLNSAGKLLQKERRALKLSLSKLHSPVLQSTKLSALTLMMVRSISDLVSDWPKMEQPSGIRDRASWRSARVQLIRSPTMLAAPATVWM